MANIREEWETHVVTCPICKNTDLVVILVVERSGGYSRQWVEDFTGDCMCFEASIIGDYYEKLGDLCNSDTREDGP